MPAYVVVDVTITDPEAMARYGPPATASIEAHGGRPLAASAPVALEGDWEPERLVVLEFPDAEAARRWYGSPEYAAAIEARRGAGNLRMVLVEGVG